MPLNAATGSFREWRIEFLETACMGAVNERVASHVCMGLTTLTLVQSYPSALDQRGRLAQLLVSLA